jgi:endonuclease YncB( thermonuclease family)
VDWARIIEVVDGDTVNLRLAGVKERVRMLGLDAPEMSSECGAKKATKDLTRKLPTDTRVKLISDVKQDDRDRYGRLLRYVMKRGVDTSWWQIRRGNAQVVLFDGAFTRLKEYRLAQRSARRHDRGIWKAC